MCTGSKTGGHRGAQSPKTVDDLMDMTDSSDASDSGAEEEEVMVAKSSAKTSKKKAKKGNRPAQGDGDEDDSEVRRTVLRIIQ